MVTIFKINSALEILVEQNLRRANELSLMENKKLTSRSPSQSQLQQSIYAPLGVINKQSSDNISASLATARGVSSHNPAIDNLVNDETSDPITKFQIQVYNLVKPPNLNNNIESSTPKNVKLSGKSVEELELENRTLKQLLSTYSENLQVYESFHKKLKMNLKNYLTTLRNDLQAQDKSKKEANDRKLEMMSKENKRLESQIKKLKERWNELVESAKKRREDNQERTRDGK